MKAPKSILFLVIISILTWFICRSPGSIAYAAGEGTSLGWDGDRWPGDSLVAQIVPLPDSFHAQVVPQAADENTCNLNTVCQREDIHRQFSLDTVPDSAVCEIDIHAFDVDHDVGPDLIPERDEVYLNGRHLGFLRGEKYQWRTTTFQFPCSILVKGSNHLYVDVDALNGHWCTAIDWVEIREVDFTGGCRVIDAGGTVAYYREVNGEPRLYSVDPATTFVVGWKDNRPQGPTNNVETTEAKGNVGVIFCWDPGAAVALQVAGWVSEGHLPTKVPLGLTADDFRRDATYDPEEGAWYLALGPRQAWTDFCLFDPMSPCIFVAAERPAR